MSHPVDIITPKAFREQYMHPFFSLERPGDYFQLLRVEDAAPYIHAPTPLHRTTFDYLVLLTDGNGEQTVDLDTFTVDRQTILHVKRGNIVSIRYISPEVKGFFLLFSTELVETQFSGNIAQTYASLPPKISPSPAQMEWCAHLCEVIASETRQGNNQAVINGLVTALLQKLMQIGNRVETSATRSVQVTFGFKQLVNRHFKENRDIGFFADALAVSENYLRRCVKETTGKSPKELIAEIAILNAKVLLQHTATDISAIAYEVGFEDPSYFGRFFKKLTQLTPGEYRQRSLQGLAG